VNVRAGAPPAWLHDVLVGALTRLAAYPDPTRARAAVARRHGSPPEQVLLTAGAAEAFVLVARALAPERAVVVHPQFTEPEAALCAAGHEVERVVLTPPFTLDPGLVPADADLVIVGNPANPTSVLHPAATLLALARPGRALVLDEAFAECVPAERGSLATCGDVPGLVILRSLTKTWGLAGLRASYMPAAAPTITRLAVAQPLWPVSTPALAATEACCGPAALADAAAWARRLADDRGHLTRPLAALPGVTVVEPGAASFLLLDVLGAAVRTALWAKGFVVRRGDTFPGLGPN
jgi:histidinol-phosphate aminotransferase